MRVEPAFSVATSGAWRASTPISPACPGTTIISASPSYAGPSGVTSETSNVLPAMTESDGGRLRLAGVLADLRVLPALVSLLGPLLAGKAAALGDRALDRPDHVERLLRELVMPAVDDFLEAADRVLELHVFARRAGELLRHEVRLRQETLH